MFRFAKRSRTVFTHFQLQTLEEVFQMSPYLTAVQKRELSGALDMTIETLSKWFQNRRQRPKKSDPDLEKFKRPDLQLFVENALETDNVIPSAPNSDTCTSGNSDRISDTDSDVKVMVVSPVDDIDKD
ncbi:hypothetical protein SNE40_023321 [Patella caerulea]|uniref:Homeobox domain-containing protein n=1 Tax=Patella caerulea TaxID=87958 RepID=A0AAN8J452_PATCE